MKWVDKVGNTYSLTWRPWSVETMEFNGNHWVPAGRAKGFLVVMDTWLGDSWFVKPSRLLFTKEQIENRDQATSDLITSRVEWEPCDCGCESSTPKDQWSVAWLRAASCVRCAPMPEPMD